MACVPARLRAVADIVRPCGTRVRYDGKGSCGHRRWQRHGAAAARRLAQDGFRIAILSSSGKGEALAAELGGVGVTGSNQSNDDLNRLVERTLELWGRIDVLVNSAGHGPRAPILELTDDQWHAGLDIYLMNVIRPTRLVTPLMVRQKGGAIINISTAWAFEQPDVSDIGGFPTGLVAYTKVFADTYAADNVRMNNVLPGGSTACPRPTNGVRSCRCSVTAPARRSRRRSPSWHPKGPPTSPGRTSGSTAESHDQSERKFKLTRSRRMTSFASRPPFPI